MFSHLLSIHRASLDALHDGFQKICALHTCKASPGWLSSPRCTETVHIEPSKRVPETNHKDLAQLSRVGLGKGCAEHIVMPTMKLHVGALCRGAD